MEMASDMLAAAAGASLWAQVLPVSLILGGAALLIWALRRGQPEGARSPSARAWDPDAAAAAREAQELGRLVAEQADRQAARLERLIEDADARIRKLERLTAAQAQPAPRPAMSDGPDPLNRRVYELADEGLPPIEIARALQQQTGKVELILALRKR